MMTFITVSFMMFFALMVMGMFSHEMFDVYNTLWQWDHVGEIPESDPVVFEEVHFELPDFDTKIDLTKILQLEDAVQFRTDLPVVDYGAVRNNFPLWERLADCDYQVYRLTAAN